MLTAGTLMVTRDSRFRLVDGYNLEISDVMPQDAGDYVCQISDGNNPDQIHTVEILGESLSRNMHTFVLSMRARRGFQNRGQKQQLKGKRRSPLVHIFARCEGISPYTFESIKFKNT